MVIGASAVELVGDQPLPLYVVFQIGVHQYQRDAAHLGNPQLRPDRCPLDLHRDIRLTAAVIQQLRNGQLVRIQQRIAFLLPAEIGRAHV